MSLRGTTTRLRRAIEAAEGRVKGVGALTEEEIARVLRDAYLDAGGLKVAGTRTALASLSTKQLELELRGCRDMGDAARGEFNDLGGLVEHEAQIVAELRARGVLEVEAVLGA